MSDGGIVWYYPAWTDASQRPESVPVSTSAAPIGLPDAVQHELAEGKFVVHALFTTRAWNVEEAEAAVKSHRVLDAAEARDLDYPLSVTK